MIHLVVISPEGERSDEHAILRELFRRGLKRYHVRKPGWSEEQLANWIEAVDPAARNRLVIHSHHRLAEIYCLGGVHGWSALPPTPFGVASGQTFERRGTLRSASTPFQLQPLWRSRSCHSLAEVAQVARDRSADSVFFSPVFESASKPGRPALSPEALSAFATWKRRLTGQDGQEQGLASSSLQVLALSGVTPDRIAQCRRWGFDGMAVMGGVWEAANPVEAFEAYQRALLPPVMCLTQDGLPLSHLEQTRRLCAAGAQWIQLRMKRAGDAEWLATAREFVAICREHGAISIINDRLDIAVAAGASGVHLGAEDGDWREARDQLGNAGILGGTVNDLAGARRAVAANCLDYVGVGPLRFTSNKARLAPILGLEGIREVIAALRGMPAWAIGGVTAEDMPAVLQTGAAGVAVSSYLFGGAAIEETFASLTAQISPLAAKRAEAFPAMSDPARVLA